MPPRRNPTKPKTNDRGGRRGAKPNWLELPPDITANILHRLGVIEILESAQKVCTAWRKICKDPGMWRVIDMENLGDLHNMEYDLQKMCRHAIDRSEGQLVDINIEYFGTDDLISYIADRASQLRRLQVACCYGSIDESWSELFKKVPLLEELGVIFTEISEEAIADAGQYCPLLKSFTDNDKGTTHHSMGRDPEMMGLADDKVIAIAKNMIQLRHLQLIGNKMTNKGLQAILDGCPHLISLDLRRCFNINLDGSLGKRCTEQIKDLRLPEDSMNDYKFQADDDAEYNNDYSDYEGMYDY